MYSSLLLAHPVRGPRRRLLPTPEQPSPDVSAKLVSSARRLPARLFGRAALPPRRTQATRGGLGRGPATQLLDSGPKLVRHQPKVEQNRPKSKPTQVETDPNRYELCCQNEILKRSGAGVPSTTESSFEIRSVEFKLPLGDRARSATPTDYHVVAGPFGLATMVPVHEKTAPASGPAQRATQWIVSAAAESTGQGKLHATKIAAAAGQPAEAATRAAGARRG